MFGLIFSFQKDLLEATGNENLIGIDSGTGDARELVELLGEAAVEGLEFDVGFEKDAGGEPVFLFEEGGEEVFDLDLLVVSASGFGLSGVEGFLEFFGETVEVHGFVPTLPL
jgi:hypothetical protein